MAKKLGLALGSGADRGFAHIGVLKALAENGLEVSFLSGSSMGAVVGAHYALHQDISKAETLAIDLPKTNWWSLVDLNDPRKSLIKGEKIRQYFIDNLYGMAKFSDTQIPLRVLATALEDGKPYVFDSGLLVDAVLASSSLPGILPPFTVNDKHLVDGGLSEAVPLDELDKLGAEIRIGVDLYSYTSANNDNYSMKDVLARSYRLYMAKLSSLEKYHNDPRTIILRPQTDEGLETLTFTHAKPNILAGYRAVNSNLDLIRGLFD